MQDEITLKASILTKLSRKVFRIFTLI